jgi:hypothetical protein
MDNPSGTPMSGVWHSKHPMEKPQFPAPKPRIDFVGEHIVPSPQSQVLKGNHGLSHNPNIISIKQLANPGVEGWDSETFPILRSIPWEIYHIQAVPHV